jgi:hypothetical protein
MNAPRENVKKQVIALLLVAVIVAAIAIYFAVNRQSEPAGAGGVFSIDAAGKTVATSDGQVTFEVPPTALPTQTKISISPIQVPDITGYTVVSAYQFGPEGTSFLKPATLNITYNPNTLPSGVNQSDLRLFVNQTSGAEELEYSIADTENHVVTGQVSHFSKILMAAKSSSSAKSSPIIVGKWKLTSISPYSPADDVYTIYPRFTARDFHLGVWDIGRWTQEGPNDFTWFWDFGTGNKGPFIDTIHVESDGDHITYHNQYGYQVKGVRLENSPPTAVIKTAAEEDEYKVGRLITLDGSGSSDPDGAPDKLTYSWTVKSPKGQVIATSTGSKAITKFTPKIPGVYSVTLTVDDQFATDKEAISLSINPNVFVSVVASDFDTNPDHPGELWLEWTVTNNGPVSVQVSAYAYIKAQTPILVTPMLYLGPFEYSFVVPAHQTVSHQDKLQSSDQAKLWGDITGTYYNGKIDNTYECYPEGDHFAKPMLNNTGSYGFDWKVGMPPG